MGGGWGGGHEKKKKKKKDTLLDKRLLLGKKKINKKIREWAVRMDPETQWVGGGEKRRGERKVKVNREEKRREKNKM